MGESVPASTRIIVVVVFLLVLVVLFNDRAASGINTTAPLQAKVNALESTVGELKREVEAMRRNNPPEASPHTAPPQLESGSSETSEKPITPVIQGSCPQSMSRKEDLENCPTEDDYLRMWADRRRKRTSDASESWTIVDVGANKGYTIASLLESLGVSGVTKEGLSRAVLTKGHSYGLQANHMCGACCDCGEFRLLENRDVKWSGLPAALRDASPTSFSKAAPAMKVNVFAFEAIRTTAAFLKEYYHPLRSQRPDHALNVTIINAAVSSRIGSTVFPDDMLGYEQGSVGGKRRTSKAVKKVETPVVTLDSALPESIDRIDVLLTDTEGHDYYVNDGATRWFPSANGTSPRARVGLFVFETHDKVRSLGVQIQKYHALGYRCFFPLRSKWLTSTPEEVLPRSLVEITPPCYDNSYTRRAVGWRNVVCIDAADPDLVSTMEHFAKTPRKPRQCFVDDQLKADFSSMAGGWDWDRSVKPNWL